MAVRYPKREQTKLVNRVKKHIAQGHTINAACTAVSEREGGKPATNTLANWVKAAGITEGVVVSGASTEAEPTEKKAPKRRRRTRSTEADNAAPENANSTEETADRSTTGDAETAATAETEVNASAETASVPSTEAAGSNDEIPSTDTDSGQTSAAELVHVRSVDTATEATSDLDDLLHENHRLRTALNDANREIRAVRDLLVVYASR